MLVPGFLYIHIPFCVKKCIYCDFLSVPFEESLAAAYTDALCTELNLKKDPSGVLSSIYIGGGTPSLLPPESFKKLFSCLRENFNFSPQIEVTAEANPGTLTRPQLELLLSLGMNRLSIGIQSFVDRELLTLGRIHTADEALSSVALIKASGIDNFSLDLMYGIPGQTAVTWEKSAMLAAELSPTHISAYELTPEIKTPYHHLLTSGTVIPPAEEAVLEMYSFAIDYFSGAGYEHYEISNFALPGFRCMHNMNYWERGEYLGAGAGAHSFRDNIRSKNTGDVSTYIESLANGILPEAGSTGLSPEDVLKEVIFLGLRKTGGINISRLLKTRISLKEALGDLAEEGYLVLNDDHLRLTRKGLVISNSVILKLFDILGIGN